MKPLKPVRRKRRMRAMNPETASSATDMTGLMPFFVHTQSEEDSYLDMYPTHKARRD